MEKTYGATQRHDQLIRYSSGRAVLIYGYGTDATPDAPSAYDYRHNFDHYPTRAEVRAVIEGHINDLTDRRILTGLTFRDLPVWLSPDNQRNFAAFAAVTPPLPMHIKVGEHPDGTPAVLVAKTKRDIADLYAAVSRHIAAALADGWAEKAAVDYDRLVPDDEDE